MVVRTGWGMVIIGVDPPIFDRGRELSREVKTRRQQFSRHNSSHSNGNVDGVKIPTFAT